VVLHPGAVPAQELRVDPGRNEVEEIRVVVEELEGGLHHDRRLFLSRPPDEHAFSVREVHVSWRVFDLQQRGLEAAEDGFDVFDLYLDFLQSHIFRRRPI